MPRETKAEREARELAEQKAEARKQRAAERKAAKEAAKETPAPSVIYLDLSEDTKKFLTTLFTQAPTVARQVAAAEPKAAAKTEPPVKTESSEIDAPGVSLTQIREAISAKAAEAKTTAIVALLGKFGAKNASSLEEASYSDFYNQLINL